RGAAAARRGSRLRQARRRRGRARFRGLNSRRQPRPHRARGRRSEAGLRSCRRSRTSDGRSLRARPQGLPHTRPDSPGSRGGGPPAAVQPSWDRRITEAAENETEIRSLLPVVEAIARIMRAGVKLLPERRGHDDLAPRRTDGAVELLDETLRVAVGCDNGLLCVELVERRDPIVLADLSTGLGGTR